jgi:glycine oxidase
MTSAQGSARIGIAGAGVLGRLLAWQLSHAGHRVEVFDPAPGPAPRSDGLGPAGFTAAGMLSPLAELDAAGPEVATLGLRSVTLWAEVAQRLAALDGQGDAACYFRQHGSLMLAHGPDLGAAQRVLSRLAAAPAGLPAPKRLTRPALAELEPALLPGLHAWFLDGEAQVMPQQVLPALCALAQDVQWHWGRTVTQTAPGQITLGDGTSAGFDLVFDVRGLGGRSAELPLRGVRGEVVWLHAPGVRLTRPLRLLHARHRVYIVPRPDERIVIGASEIESEDRSPVSLRSAVELMAAAHSVLPALAEARIHHMETNLRPALPDNAPKLTVEPGRVAINGLFRHGWLLAPALVEQALQQVALPVMSQEPT